MNPRRYLLQLISQGEHQQQDFKYKISDAAKLAKSVSAFANTDGGRLLIGVRDDGSLAGVRSEEEIYMMHAAAYKYCRPAASIKFDTYIIDGRTIVVATVPPADQKPVCALNEEGAYRAYIRIADENIVASPVHLAIWREQAASRPVVTVYSDAQTTLISAMQGQQPLTLGQIVRRARLPRRQVIATLARFVRYDLVDCRFADHRFIFSLK